LQIPEEQEEKGAQDIGVAWAGVYLRHTAADIRWITEVRLWPRKKAGGIKSASHWLSVAITERYKRVPDHGEDPLLEA